MEKVFAENVLSALNSMDLPSSRQLNQREREIAQKILSLVKNLEEATISEIIEDEELVTLSSEEETEAEVVFEPLQGPDNEFFPLEYIKQVVDFKESGNYSFSTIQHRFRRVRHPIYLSRFQEYLRNMGTVREKYHMVSAYVWERFQQSRTMNRAVHDLDIRRWALEKSRELRLDSFRGSHWWVNEFKKRNKIVSRRVTNFISYRHEVQQDEIEQSALVFTGEINTEIIPNFSPDEIFNTDQSGFQYEMHRDRTLAMVGQRSVEVRVENTRARTHSYTIQPMISMSGKLLSPMMLVLQETTGSFGPMVGPSLPQPPNVYITCTRSGKVELPTLQEWKHRCFLPNVGDRACLLLDSFSSHRSQNAFTANGKEVAVRFIPPGTTSLIQPLDVFFFRQWKAFVKRFSDRVLLDNLFLDLHSRHNVIKLHVLIHNQFSAPIFQPMIRTAWLKSGYSLSDEMFDHPDRTIFDVELEECSKDDCSRSAFIQCAHCRTILCLSHFFTSLHFHPQNL